MPAKHLLRLMFEWGGGCLWCGNRSALDTFSVGPVEDRLPLSSQVRRRLQELSAWHDTSLNRDYPPDPGSWHPEKYERFDRAADDILNTIRAELGSEFEVLYERL